jgi:flagellar biosynthetic protein FliR
MEHYATAQQVFVGGLIFARLAGVVMLIPGIGEAFIPARIRLSLAFVMALALCPVLAAGAPAEPASVGDLAGAIVKEALIGLMIGGILRIFMNALAVCGEVVSIQTTLSFAQTANPGQATPSTTLGTFLGLLALVLIMATNLHHLFLSAIVRSYALFPFRKAVPVSDAGFLAIQTLGRSVALGLQLAAPVMVFAFIFNVATGLVGRVMPQFQVFFVASPLMLLTSLSIFALSLGVIGMVFIDRYRDLLQAFG